MRMVFDVFCLPKSFMHLSNGGTKNGNEENSYFVYTMDVNGVIVYGTVPAAYIQKVKL